MKYKPGDDVGPLEHWPFDAPASAYRIVDGTPKAFGRLEAGGPGHTTRFGIWRCTKGVFECIEQGDELMTILAGRCQLTLLDTGEAQDLGPGDSLFVRDTAHVRWDVSKDVTKVFFGHKANGY